MRTRSGGAKRTDGGTLTGAPFHELFDAPSSLAADMDIDARRACPSEAGRLPAYGSFKSAALCP
jgi:hypothetical protein